MNAKILVADESPTIHKIVSMAFEDEGITVEGITRGEHALEYMVGFQPDIVLADIHLPGTDGYELCRQIKNSRSFGGIRVILLTSDFEDIDQVEMEISRADDFISKPFKTEEILNKVKSQLKLSEPENIAPTKDVEPSPEPESNKVIQDEFEDIINQSNESSTEEPVEPLFAEDEDIMSSIEEKDLETGVISEPGVEESRDKKHQAEENEEQEKDPLPDTPKINEVPPEILLDLPEEAFHAETRPFEIRMDELDSVFQSVLSSPQPGLEEAPQPGSKPNLIEETLSFMAEQHIEEQANSFTNAEPINGETRQPPIDSVDHLPDSQIVKEHIDQVIELIPEDIRNGRSHATLEKTVREVLGEIAPEIIRKVIQEEIETIKKAK